MVWIYNKYGHVVALDEGDCIYEGRGIFRFMVNYSPKFDRG